MLLHLRYYGDPVLRKKCSPVGKITEEIRQLVLDMIETMDNSNGIGLAAPQVGKDLRLFVLRNYISNEKGELSLSDPKVFINPRLFDHSQEMVEEEEGCLSIPGIRSLVPRPVRIKIEATDLEGKLFTEELEGYNARVRMHENDHLNGVLFIDRIDERTRREIEPLLRDIKKTRTVPR